MTTLRKTSSMSESKVTMTTLYTETRKMRAVNLLEVRWGISNCSYSATQCQIETVDRHRQKVDDIEPNQSLLGGNVFASISILDNNVAVGESDNLANSLEHKTSLDFYNDLSRVQQSMQLEGNRRSSDSEEETEEEKRPKLNCEQTEPSQCQSPEKEKRDNLCKEAMLVPKVRTNREKLDNFESILEETSEVGAIDAAILDRLNAGDVSVSQSQLMTTAQWININPISCCMFLNISEQDHEMTNLEGQLTLSEIVKALKDVFAKPNKAKKKHHEERKLKKEEKEDKKVKDNSEKSEAKKKKRKEAAKKSKTESNGGQSAAIETDETSNPAALTGAKAADVAEPQNLGPNPPANQPPPTSINNPQHVAPNFQQLQIPTNFNFGQPQFPAAPPTPAPAGGASWSAPWSGPSPVDMALEQVRQQEAVQAEAMSRRMRLDNLRNELSSVQSEIES